MFNICVSSVSKHFFSVFTKLASSSKYSILSFVIGPIGGLYLKKNKEGILWGMITGCVASILLWQQYGEKMISLE